MTKPLESGPDSPTLHLHVPSVVPLRYIVNNWCPGSHDWAWVEEIGDIMSRDDFQYHRGMFQDSKTAVWYGGPVFLGTDGRVLDGHHRLVAAMLTNRFDMSIPIVLLDMKEGE